MRIVSAILHVLLTDIILASAASIRFTSRDDDSSITKRDNVQIGERATPLLNNGKPPSSTFPNLPMLPSTFLAPPKTNTTTLNPPEIFAFRVPDSTIQIDITTTHPIDGRILGNSLLAMHEYLNDHIDEHGDGPLAPKDDPFVWQPSGPQGVNSFLRLASSTLPVSLTAQSVAGEHMPWSVLLLAVEGLYLCLPAAGRNFGAHFEIWDFEDHEHWGFGEVKAV